MGDGHIRLRKGLMDHLNKGYMRGKDLSTYVSLHFYADYNWGIAWKICAPFIARFLNEKTRNVQASLLNLEKSGYIKRLNHRGQITYYPVVIDKYETYTGLFIRADKMPDNNTLAFTTELKVCLNGIQNELKPNLNGIYYVPIKEIKNIILKEVKEIKNNKDYKSIYDHYLSLGLKKHRTYTDSMRNSIQLFCKKTKSSIEDCKELLNRHKNAVDITEKNSHPITERGLAEFFGQKVYQGKELIAEQYMDGGKFSKIKQNNEEDGFLQQLEDSFQKSSP